MQNISREKQMKTEVELLEDEAARPNRKPVTTPTIKHTITIQHGHKVKLLKPRRQSHATKRQV